MKIEQGILIDLERECDLIKDDLEAKRLDANFDIGSQLRRWLSGAIKAAPMSRYEIAAKMSELLGKEISKFQLDSWTAESKEGYHLPAEYVPALTAVLDDIGGLKILAAPLGVKVLENRELMWLEYGKLRRTEQSIRTRKRQLEKKLQGGQP
jgi:hypothetical protein